MADEDKSMELKRLIQTVMSQREDQDQAVHGDNDGLAHAYVGTEYADEVLVQIREESRKLKQQGG